MWSQIFGNRHIRFRGKLTKIYIALLLTKIKRYTRKRRYFKSFAGVQSSYTLVHGVTKRKLCQCYYLPVLLTSPCPSLEFGPVPKPTVEHGLDPFGRSDDLRLADIERCDAEAHEIGCSKIARSRRPAIQGLHQGVAFVEAKTRLASRASRPRGGLASVRPCPPHLRSISSIKRSESAIEAERTV